MFRAGIQRLFLDEPDIRVTGEASNGSDALAAIKHKRYDVVLLDINMDGRSGLDVLASVQASGPTPVLMLSMYPAEQYGLVALQRGARGYIAKDAEPAELMAAIRRVATGGLYLSAKIAQDVRAQLEGHDERPPHQRLSVREYQIMVMLLRGMSLTDIGREMMISVKTVSTHRTHILEKLSVSSTAELVLYAVRKGLVH